MKTFDQLRTYGKAKLLFDLFPEETAKSIGFIEATAQQFQTHPKIIDKFQTEDFWKEVAGQILKTLAFCKNRIYRSHSLFADQLFDGYYAVFSVYCLKQYIQTPEIKYTKFSRAVELLF